MGVGLVRKFYHPVDHHQIQSHCKPSMNNKYNLFNRLKNFIKNLFVYYDMNERRSYLLAFSGQILVLNPTRKRLIKTEKKREKPC